MRFLLVGLLGLVGCMPRASEQQDVTVELIEQRRQERAAQQAEEARKDRARLDAQIQARQAEASERQREREAKLEEQRHQRELRDQETRARADYAGELLKKQDALWRAEAAERGFDFVQLGLLDYLKESIQSGLPTGQLRKTAIRLSVDDQRLKILQVFGDGVLVAEDDVRMLIKGDKSRMYEGGTLGALNHTAYRVVGLKSYNALLGIRQAFVVEPIPEFTNAEELPAFRELIGEYGKDGRLFAARYHSGGLVECFNLDAKKIQALDEKSLKTMLNLTLLQDSCEQFSRPPIAKCDTANGGQVVVYATPPGFESFSETDCTKGGRGTWTALQ